MYSGYLKACAINMGINFAKMNFSIGLAKAFNPNRDMRQKPQKGEKVYDWENAKWFALNWTDCQKIRDYLAAGQFSNNLFLTHDSGGNYNYFSLTINGDSTFINIGPKGDTVGTALYGENYSMFMAGVNYVLDVLPYHNDMLKEIAKIVAGQSAFNPGNGPDGKPWSQSNGNNYNPNNGDGEWSNSVSYTPGPDANYQQPQQPKQYNNGGGYQKKQYNNNGYQKKQYSNNYNNGGNYQRNNYQPQANVQPPRPPQQAYQAPQNNVPPTPPQPMAQPPVPTQPMNNNQPPVPPAPPVDFDMSM
jgi:hypothetical protein